VESTARQSVGHLILTVVLYPASSMVDGVASNGVCASRFASERSNELPSQSARHYKVAKLLFEIKFADGHRDAMISYTHSHAEFTKKAAQVLERANVTTWLDLMNSNGIGGGAVRREEMAGCITNPCS